MNVPKRGVMVEGVAMEDRRLCLFFLLADLCLAYESSLLVPRILGN
jgi:hypothetical protein